MKLRERAYERFTERLLAGEIEAGQFISQRELTGITGMTLGPIRELVPRLEADGLIRTLPRRGMQVIPVDVEFIHNAFQFRQVLEREAVAAFAMSATEVEIAEQRRSHAQILAEAKRGVTSALRRRAQQTDWALHDLMIDRLENEIISRAYQVNSVRIRLIDLERIPLIPRHIVSALQEHLAVIEAVARRDAVGAASAMDRHLASDRTRVLEV